MSSTNTALFDDKLNREKTYWLEKFAGEPRAEGIPLDHKRPAVFCGERSTVTVQIDPETEALLRRVCDDKEALMFTLLVASLKICLHKYTGDTDIIIGTAIHERYAEVTSFNKVLVLRDEVHPDRTVKQFLEAVKRTLSEAYANQKYPFERLVKLLQLEQASNRPALFNVVAILDTPHNRENVRHLMSDATIVYSIGERRVAWTIEYNPELFVFETIEIFGRHLETILRALLHDAEVEVSQLELLSSRERHDRLVRFNETQSPYRKHETIVRLIEEQVERTPDHTAITFEQRHVTYQELNIRANRLAYRLRREGIKPGALAGICIEHSIETLIAILGVLKAGGGYVPLDPHHPKARLAFVCADAGFAVLLTEQGLLDTLPDTNAKVICLDSEWEIIARESAENPAAEAGSDDLAYVIYTSGSTGDPKGVAIRHRSLVNYSQWASQVYVQNERLAFPLYSSLAFDLTVTSIYTPLITGNRIIVYRPEGRESALFEILRDNQIGVLKLTPSHLALIKDTDHSKSKIKRLIVGGEAFDTEVARQIHESFGGEVEIFNEYGPTEATVGCMLHKYDPVSDRRALVPIGKPAANTQIYTLDENLKPVAENVLGELYVSGDGLAAGYFNNEKLTLDRFIDNPFIPGQKMYKTGDLVRWLPGGNVEYVGRRDEQVKFHGYRVELNEIKSALNQHPQISKSIIAVLKDQNGYDVMIAYYVSEHELEAAHVHAFLSERLVRETIPNIFLHLQHLPLTLNGKIDMRALPGLAAAREKLKREFVAARNPVEEMLAGAWGQLLGLQKVSIHDNFFELGGHSLLATQLFSRIRHALNVELPLRILFESPTIAEFAERLESAKLSRTGMPTARLKPIPRDRKFPLSFAQQRLWFIDQLVPGSTFYNVSSAVRLRGKLNISALERTITEVSRRHEVLRTTFPMVDGEPAQVFAAVQPLKLPITDLSALSEQEREGELQEFLVEFARRPFNLSHDSLLRVSLVRLGEEDHAVMLLTHHIVCDGWSMGVLVKEVSTIYGAFNRGEPSPLAELPIQYADFAVWQREWLRGAALEEQLSYWREQLRGAPPVLELPTDRPRPAVQSYRGASHSFRVSAEVSAGLKALSREEGATLFMTLLAAFKVLLFRYSRQTDIVVGTPIAGRNHVEIEPLIGFFVNTLVIRTDLSGAPRFREVLRQVRETALEAYAHENLPFEKIVEELNPERALSHTPLVQVVFGFQSLLEKTTDVSELTMSSLGHESGTARFDVVQNIFETEQGLSGSLHCNTDLFDPETIKRISEHFQELLHSIVEHPDAAISTLSLLSEAERQQQLVLWNNTAADYPRNVCLHELFEAQVGSTPEAVALVHEAEQVTYRELNERTNQLAHYLGELGVGPETLVALCFERSVELVVSLLGVLKAGGAYLPLDPQYPHERLTFMLQDAGVSLLLTQSALAATGIGGWTGAQTRVIEIEREWDKISQRSVANPDVSCTVDNLAYVIYTSGSTGAPKGTLVTHYNVTRLLDATAPHFKFSGDDVWTLFHSYAFDFSVWELWGALAYGGQLVVVPHSLSRSPAQFYELLRREGVTVLNQTPSAFRQLGVVDGRASEEERAGLALRLVIFGGEALEWQSLRGWLERYGDQQPRLVNMYGITETTVHVTLSEVSLKGLEEATAGSRIGKSLDDLQVYVLDGGMELLPQGVWGELYVGGAGVARGYLKRAELTAEKFVPHPFSAGGKRLYRTGDMGRYRAGGELEYVGRADSQVKIRGFRIELGEIESVLGGHEDVQEVVVLLREDAPGDKRLVAYVVRDEAATEEAEEPASQQLRAYLKEKLPEYMVPSMVVFLKQMPLTPNGKVDRRALPAPDSARPAAASLRAPNSSLQHWLADRWCEVLHLDSLGIDEDFFDLGGDSIKAAIVINRLQQEMGEIIHVVTIFDASSVAGFASYLEGQYPEAVQRLFRVNGGEEVERTRAGGVAKISLEGGGVTGVQIEHLRALTTEARLVLRQLDGKAAAMEERKPQPEEVGAGDAGRGHCSAGLAGSARLRPALFVLSAPRSGSTLLRVMLGGHSRLFAPPELELLGYETMSERRQALSGRDQFWLEGAIRGVMQARGCEAKAARDLIGEYEASCASTREFYGALQEWIGIGRMLVDKTPSYALELEVLARAEHEFDGAHYIHLVRRPEAVIHSYEEAHLEQIFPRFPHPFSGREVAELVWVISQQNILEFLREVSSERQHRVVFEELVAEPRRVLEGVSEFLGLKYEEGMSEPYRERAERMTDGVQAESKMLGDVKFHEHREIEAGVGERWREAAGGLEIGEVTKELAKSLGYVAQAEANKLATIGAQRKSLTPIRRVDEKADDEQIAADISVMSDQEVEAMLDSVLA